MDIMRIAISVFALFVAACAHEPEHPPWQCNDDFVCDSDENQEVCPSDCVSTEATGQGPAAAVCDAQENWTFVQACRETCGNGKGDEGETVKTCPRDFPGPGCGDGVCAPDEYPPRCPTDCHLGSCGDGTCELHENAIICAEDCTTGCGDGMCQAGEEATCEWDCAPCASSSCVCGDMVCGPGESTTSCPQDCAEPFCGNGTKEEGEPCDDGNKVDTDACTNSCTIATCGDGFLWIGEEVCDDGADNGPGKACNATCGANTCGDGDIGPNETCDDGNADDTDDCAACQDATCGDGFVWAGMESCDDGNDVDTDECTKACEPASCGDGIVQDGLEECDDGAQVATDGCSNACLKPRRVIFVTNATFDGNLGALGGADLKCQTAAMNAGLANAATFKAWLSDGASWPAKRFDTLYVGMYVLTDGTNVAENGFADLTDGELLHAIDRTELNTKVPSAPWTNVKADGTSAGENDCNAWTNNKTDFYGGFGHSTAKDAKWTDAMDTIPCSAPTPVYCIEDP